MERKGRMLIPGRQRPEAHRISQVPACVLDPMSMSCYLQAPRGPDPSLARSRRQL